MRHQWNIARAERLRTYAPELIEALQEIEALADEHADADYSDAAGRAVPNSYMVIRDIASRAIEKAK